MISPFEQMGTAIRRDIALRFHVAQRAPICVRAAPSLTREPAAQHLSCSHMTTLIVLNFEPFIVLLTIDVEPEFI